ncbi:N-acetyltransferase [Nonlabens spongiae]|uniref:N-acetyltransferase n=1 Tax=Nonlabens spongiae TaxID=331648 RepID=A0A1W6MIB9_9FLAO|nr:N-acetyltransferase [Nonlabens spongiae]ARN77209.1 N-acetyltransferase [Nonlabens spongiae]
MEDNTQMEITDNDFLRQYEGRKGDLLARIEYAEQDRKIFLTKLIIPEEVEDDVDFRNEFIKAVFDSIRENKDVKVVPTHPKIAGFVRRYRNIYKDMLPVGIAI